MVKAIDIKHLTLEELSGIVGLYPWFAAARKELCERMWRDGTWSDAQFAEASLYMASGRILYDLMRRGREIDCSDSDIPQPAEPRPAEKPAEPASRQVFVVGADYFSQAQYGEVRRPDDNIFSSFATKAREENFEEFRDADPLDFCTETLAHIYEEQGYPDEAKKIYSQLSLRYPEKSVYFASLIEKLDN
ncbi:MAG: hypothetical protein J5871_06805 [Bacteroidales bacterium]|nr:hypothetical protein [Bacteroidales bacterium]